MTAAHTHLYTTDEDHHRVPAVLVYLGSRRYEGALTGKPRLAAAPVSWRS